MKISVPVLLVGIVYGGAFWTTFSFHAYNLVSAIF